MDARVREVIMRVSAVGGEEGRSQQHEAEADAALCPLLLLVCRTRAPSFLSPLFSLSSLSPSNGMDVESCVFPIGEWQITEQRRAESSRNRLEESVLATRLSFVRASLKTFPLLLSLLCLPPVALSLCAAANTAAGQWVQPSYVCGLAMRH